MIAENPWKPIGNLALNLCRQIERIGASREQTDASILASNLCDEIIKMEAQVGIEIASSGSSLRICTASEAGHIVSLPWERWKRDYPGKWANAQRMAVEVYKLQPGTPEYESKSHQLFVELGAGCADKPGV